MARTIALLFAVLTVAVRAQQDAPTISQVEVKAVTPFRYAALEMKGDYAQHGEAFQRLYELAARQNLGYPNEVIGIYFDDPMQVPAEDLRWLLGFALSEGQQAQEPLVEKRYDYPMIAQIVYRGPYTEEMSSAYQELMSFVMSNGYSIAGPVMQKYIGMPTMNSQGQWSGTLEISLPVSKP